MNQMLRQPLTDSDIRRRAQIFTILDENGEDLDLTEAQFDRARQSYGAVGDWLSGSPDPLPVPTFIPMKFPYPAVATPRTGGSMMNPILRMPARWHAKTTLPTNS